MIIEILFALLFWPQGDPASCPPGKVMSGGISTSGCTYPLGCRTLEEKREGDEFIARCHCSDMGLLMVSGNYSYSRSSDWKDGHCVQKETWSMRAGKEWTEITKDEFYRRSCEGLSTYQEKDGKFVEVRIYPKPEWKECQKKPLPGKRPRKR